MSSVLQINVNSSQTIYRSTTLKKKTAVFYANYLNCIIKYVDNKVSLYIFK